MPRDDPDQPAHRSGQIKMAAMCAQRRSRPALVSIRSDQSGCYVCPEKIQISLGIDQVRSKWLPCVPRDDPDQPLHRSGQIKMAVTCAQRQSDQPWHQLGQIKVVQQYALNAALGFFMRGNDGSDQTGRICCHCH